MKKPLCAAILWHMHQPDYRDVQTGETYLPWTRFHAVKDYYDMGAMASQERDMHVTINIVPSLIDQLQGYSSGTARETYAALTLRDASDLDIEEKSFLLRSFFQLSHKNMVSPYPRYRELLDLRGMDEKGKFTAGLQRYTERDYRDLQLWYNLSWCGQELRCNPEIAQLFKKGKDFDESDKKRLLEIQYAFIGRILPLYRKIMESGQTEIAISPCYHPILPLLCDVRSAREALPSIPLPSESFAFPEDAKEHIRRAVQIYKDLFGRPVQGMWPSEGSISDSALALARDAGLRWLASDEEVLSNSLHKAGLLDGPLTPERKYSAYRWGDDPNGPCLFFRDHALSDLLGFAYHNWIAEEAVSDFLGRLNAIHERLPDDGRNYVVPIILDGENAWEHYPYNGSEFLSLLYHKLSKSKNIRTATFSEYLDLETHRAPLKSVVAGSWIYGNLATWAGHPEKNRAWEEMAAARRFLNTSRLKKCDPKKLESAYQEMMIAEGSDWFWWYGDDHETENAAEYDGLFRGHLKNVYKFLDATPPLELDEPIKNGHIKALRRDPVHTMTPQLDGKETGFFEWISAGSATRNGGESMHRIDRILEKAHFGFDFERLYLRMDLKPEKMAEFPPGSSIQLQFASPVERSLALERSGNNQWRCRTLHWPLPASKPEFAAENILELGISLDVLGVREASEVKLFVSVMDGLRETERFPSNGFLNILVDPWGLDQREWLV